MNTLLAKIVIQTEIILFLAAIAHIFGHTDVGLAAGALYCVYANVS